MLINTEELTKLGEMIKNSGNPILQMQYDRATSKTTGLVKSFTKLQIEPGCTYVLTTKGLSKVFDIEPLLCREEYIDDTIPPPIQTQQQSTAQRDWNTEFESFFDN
jgi:hypothetical protein